MGGTDFIKSSFPDQFIQENKQIPKNAEASEEEQDDEDEEDEDA
jgi:hypothetical protein